MPTPPDHASEDAREPQPADGWELPPEQARLSRETQDQTAADWARTVTVPEPPRARNRVWIHVALLLLTIVTTTWVGVDHYVSYLLDFRNRRIVAPLIPLLIRGFWYSGTILAILGSHEMGHYFACRYYGIDASLPYFIPAPLPLTGTLGAFIRIRQPIFSKRMLFDIGVAGPFAGFIVAVPALFIGVAMSHVARVPPHMPGGLELGEPLLFKAASWLLWRQIPEGYSLNLHPMAFAAWFGLLATALNLFPIGQLDGGHVSYAVLGRRSSIITIAMIVIAIALTFVSMSWLFWTVLMIGMLIAFGPHHPRTIDEEEPLDTTRRVLAFVAFVVFVLCFTPAPIQPLDLIR